MPLVPWSSQAQGFFATDGPGSFPTSWNSDDNVERRRRAGRLANEKGVDPTTVALAYVLAQPFPVFPIIGPATMRETASSLEALTVQITPDEVAWLNLER